jgi:ABC-type transporter Mla MlaB component
MESLKPACPARDEVPSLSLPEELTIYTAGALHPAWMDWLACRTSATDEAAGLARVAGAGVAEVDAAGLQLLLALDRAVAERGSRLEVENPSPTLRSGCEALGLGPWLLARTAPAVAAQVAP